MIFHSASGPCGSKYIPVTALDRAAHQHHAAKFSETKNDIPSARKLFGSGVPIFMMPVDATQLKLDEVRRAILFGSGTPLTDGLTLLYQEMGPADTDTV